MRYLSFDIECCDGRSICEFGYVITDESFNIIDSVAVLLAALTYYICSRSGKKLIRAEGVLMVSIFLCYYAYILLN